jgi:hypothetical protein
MNKYNDSLIVGKQEPFLDETQLGYLRFEQEALRKKYVEYLERAQSEAEMHYFFETNPIVLPGLRDLHNGPLGEVVISKLQLSNEYETDFAFISVDSATAQITLVEIESPTMQLFRESDNLFTSNFNRTLQQVKDWTLWIEQNATYVKELFREIYFRGVFRHQRMVSRSIIVAGRRREIQKNAQREKRWAGISREGGPIEVMSYDRLAETLSVNPVLLQELICRPKRYISQILRSRR